jgi:hypothetical protein
VIRFSAVLVVGAIGVLIGGIATSKLLLVYVAIGLSAAALVALAIGVVLKREELFSEHGQALAPAAAGAGAADEPLLGGKSSTLPNGLVDPPDTPLPAVAAAAFGQAARGAERSAQDRPAHPASGQPAYGQPAYGQAAPPAREAPPSRDWSGRMAGQPNAPLRQQPAGEPAAPAPSWRERPSPASGGAVGSRGPVPPAGSPPSAPGWPSSPSWFDRPAGPRRDAGDEAPKPADTPGDDSAPASDSALAAGNATPEGVMPEDAMSQATARIATVEQAGTAPRADAARADTPETVAARADTPAPGAAAAANAADAGPNNPGSSGTSPNQVTVVPGVPRYHLEDCILIRFMADDDLQKMTVQQATAAGCTPCRACQPAAEAT